MTNNEDRGQDIERKLAAIMSADIVGYSRLMELDEGETLRRLWELRTTIDKLIEQRGGRVAGAAGDSLLAEFPSVIEAAACTIEVQQATGALNESYGSDKKMLLRIGLNVGDVIEQDDTIFGDGVNVAARLQALAPVGGICISQLARDHLENKESYQFEELGFLSLKNIARPVQAFNLVLGDRAAQSLRQGQSGSVTSAEIAFWEGISESSYGEEYLAYLEKYPNGHFSAVARSRLARLDDPSSSTEDELKIELAFWESVRESWDPKFIQAYIERFPEGQFMELARLALEQAGRQES
jgi:class 3 adenylate cyclase